MGLLLPLVALKEAKIFEQASSMAHWYGSAASGGEMGGRAVRLLGAAWHCFLIIALGLRWSRSTSRLSLQEPWVEIFSDSMSLLQHWEGEPLPVGPGDQAVCREDSPPRVLCRT